MIPEVRSAPSFEVLYGRNCRLDLDRPRIMGILNVTPDSFFDGGRHDSLERARRRAAEMLAEGADLIDIGGESTRPGAQPVSQDEELRRVIPVIEALARDRSVPLSIDTSKSRVADEALQAGAAFVNDISGLTFDGEMAAAVARNGAGLFLMHTRGRPNRMQQDTHYADLLAEVLDGLRRSLEIARAAGIPEERLAVDPGIGFGKDVAGNLLLLKRLDQLKALGRPILLGTSRKSFIGKVLGLADPDARLAGSLATVVMGVERGAMLFRAHDVRPTREAALLAWEISRAG